MVFFGALGVWELGTSWDILGHLETSDLGSLKSHWVHLCRALGLLQAGHGIYMLFLAETWQGKGNPRAPETQKGNP